MFGRKECKIFYYHKYKPIIEDNPDLNVSAIETGVIKGEYIVDFVLKEGDDLEGKKLYFKKLIVNIGGTVLHEFVLRPSFLVILNEEQLEKLSENNEVHTIRENISTMYLPY